MPFQFPDPSVQTEVVHPVTGEHWHYVNGAWEVEDSDLHTYDDIMRTHTTLMHLQINP